MPVTYEPYDEDDRFFIRVSGDGDPYSLAFDTREGRDESMRVLHDEDLADA